ncbi:TIGR03749 family integrating conjugative element protein [Vibrio mediterranei]
MNSAWATDILVWDKRPLQVRLEVNKERIIEMPDNVRVGLPEYLYSKVNISTTGGVMYVTAKEPFTKTRATIRLASNNEEILIDFFGVESIDDMEPELIKIIKKDDAEKAEAARDAYMAQSNGVSVKDIIQYASHDFYAPPRLKNTNKPIIENEIRAQLRLDLMFMGRSASLFDLKALKQYRTSRYTLTAILVTNRTSQPQEIVYSDLYPDFIAASSQHIDVGPAGSQEESTILYLVTSQPISNNAIYAM